MSGQTSQTDAAASFEPLRLKLGRVAYRMLGSIADAEDVVQDAFLRWASADRTIVQTPEAYLTRVVTRLCLDQLKSARRKREVYPGPWLPEPLVEDAEEEVDDVTLPLMMALERLSPLERAAFILHDVFGLPFDEVAVTLDRDAAAARQLASRARAHVRADRPRFDLPRKRGLEIAEAFYAASRSGDMAALQSMLAADVQMHSDGGGKRSAASIPLIGMEAVMRVWTSLQHVFKRNPAQSVRYAYINGLPGLVTQEGDGVQTTALDIRDGRIAGIYIVRNPDKLTRVDATRH